MGAFAGGALAGQLPPSNYEHAIDTEKPDSSVSQIRPALTMMTD
jgi:hypothetical protein